MTVRKDRLTVTVDAGVVQAGNRAVAAGVAPSLSAWVNGALVARVARDARLEALSAAIDHFEAQHGEITPNEMFAQERADREGAVVVRGKSQRPSARPARPGGR